MLNRKTPHYEHEKPSGFAQAGPGEYDVETQLREPQAGSFWKVDV